ncbi:15342_t:CDS:2 [Acaulospora colombiana]|uniref:15342_t:CDS:1 n=1 Tax=Acaulospora colombiana TaxID=27376 RepID=A0ACA9KBB5_9GLOM|nr:15342_t:CDS:2 [Acaulospora colombiana]
MEAKETYYEILGIDREATEDDIRKAYRRQALLWHPDKNVNRREEAEAKFKLISEAYEVLSDGSMIEKRRIYDLYGEEGLKNGGPAFETRGPQFAHFQFHDPNELFRHVFGDNIFSNPVFSNPVFSDPVFSDPFFFDPFARSPFFGNSMFSGPMPGSSMSSSSFFSTNSLGGGGGYKKTTTTQIIDGVRTTVTRTEDAHGNVTEEIITSNNTGHLEMNNTPQYYIQNGHSTTNNSRRSIPIQEGGIYYVPVYGQQHERNSYERISGNQNNYEPQQGSSRRRPSEGSMFASNYRG